MVNRHVWRQVDVIHTQCPLGRRQENYNLVSRQVRKREVHNDSPRPIHSPSSSPPRQIFLLASAFFRKGENAAAATVNLHRHKHTCRHWHEVSSQHWAESMCGKQQG